MKKLESNCVGCGKLEYCGSCKLNKYTEHYHCDKCGAEGILYHYDNKELCIDCLSEIFKIVEGSEVYV